MLGNWECNSLEVVEGSRGVSRGLVVEGAANSGMMSWSFFFVLFGTDFFLHGMWLFGGHARRSEDASRHNTLLIGTKPETSQN